MSDTLSFEKKSELNPSSTNVLGIGRRWRLDYSWSLRIWRLGAHSLARRGEYQRQYRRRNEKLD
jgi:hypothetical protein